MASRRSGELPEACPVDHSAREEYLKAAQKSGDFQQFHTRPTAVPTSTTGLSSPSARRRFGGQWMSFLTFWKKLDSPIRGAATPLHSEERGRRPGDRERQLGGLLLGTERTVSSIPRTTSAGPSACPVNHNPSSHSPAPSSHYQSSPAQPSLNAETAAPETSASGNWVYPSESQFFSALRRKGHSAKATDMSIVVPIHNAVNERAWSQILEWETPYPAPCGGPKLHSFSGDSKKLTPKARIMSLLGYQRPFDRHDWTVDRCGTRIEYVIDFYSGKGKEGKISFYLDVRPKLNTWEGIKMRVLKMVGIA